MTESVQLPMLERAERGRFVYAQAPRNVYWEMTRACDLACRHCRANAIPNREVAELTTEEAKGLVREVRELGSMLILTGGDPMKRPDLFELIEFARSLHVPVSVTPSTTPTLTREVFREFRRLGVAAIGMSLDGSSPKTHDAFRGVEGTFDAARQALGWAREVGLPVQVNTTVAKSTLGDIPATYEWLTTMSPPVKRWSLFLLVPTGRAASAEMPSAAEVEELMAWVYQTSKNAPFHLGTVEAPHYRRYWLQRRIAEGASAEEIEKKARRMGLGVRDGNGVIFVSHRGDVFPAGFLPSPHLGNVREASLTEIYRNAPALTQLRDMDQLEGKCATCEYRWPCGGSRARAYATTGNVMGSDPSCAYHGDA